MYVQPSAPPVNTGTPSETLLAMEQEVIDEIDRHRTSNSTYAESGNVTWRLWDDRGNPYAFGDSKNFKQWLAYAKETGVFVGYPAGWRGEKISALNDNGRAFAFELDRQLEQLNEMFAQIAPYANDAQMEALFQSVFTPSAPTFNQARGKEEMPESARAGYLAYLMNVMQDDPEQFEKIVARLHEHNFGGVLGNALRGAQEEFQKAADQANIDRSKVVDGWQWEAALELAQDPTSLLWRARRNLSPEEAAQFEAFVDEKRRELIKGTYAVDSAPNAAPVMFSQSEDPDEDDVPPDPKKKPPAPANTRTTVGS